MHGSSSPQQAVERAGNEEASGLKGHHVPRALVPSVSGGTGGSSAEGLQRFQKAPAGSSSSEPFRT
eukprot:9608139-Alexandrium_andersonii.AAC.1